MTKNTLLDITVIISRILKVIVVIGAIALTGLLIYIEIDQNAFKGVEIKIANSSNSAFGYHITGSETYRGAEANESPFTIDKIKTLTKYVFYLKSIGILFLIFVAFNSFEKIMLSVKSLKTFSSGNDKLFKRIGFCILGILVLQSYTVMRYNYGMQMKISVNFVYIIYALIAFVMAQIFKEAHKLQEENDLTI
ncbi:DUF2975 domain-containing protein [Winogradskyella maritima]|uniref:DUF2975 domain-containing protein n=1 Tax=Winogradskyella maritima TaxID=1517766 RepID=A0ABV8AF19_9FLAO|nr:DUF2975 domain-containing protein [Winogradskyella maritima]